MKVATNDAGLTEIIRTTKYINHDESSGSVFARAPLKRMISACLDAASRINELQQLHTRPLPVKHAPIDYGRRNARFPTASSGGETSTYATFTSQLRRSGGLTTWRPSELGVGKACVKTTFRKRICAIRVFPRANRLSIVSDEPLALSFDVNRC